jgi:GNAT superfamily N-acetyltransferase
VEERVVLADGTALHVRPVRAEDKHLFRLGLEHLSPQSRFFRFLGPRARLSDAELRYLTELDGFDHFALGAVHRGAGGAEEPVAVARYVRLAERPDCAEAAITVVDAWQGRGVGTWIFLRLVTEALRRGVGVFRCDVHDRNVRMRDLLARHAPGATRHAHGSVSTYEFRLFDP